MTLTALQIKNAKEGLHADGNGLYLQVTKRGSKSWIFRYQINGRRREMGLGALIDVPVVEARMKIPALRASVGAKIDPIEERRTAANEKAAQATDATLKSTTFKMAALEYIELKRPGWSNPKHAAQWGSTLAQYAFPLFGDERVGSVTTEHLLGMLAPIWASKTETATRLRQRIENILDYAKFKKWRVGENPARWDGHLEHTLPKPNSVRVVQHHPALPYLRMGAFMADLQAREGIGARALEFAILTAARSAEVRGAQWAEIDMENRVWIVPAIRMKAKREHRVPLSDRATRLLESIPRIADESLIFPAAWSRGGARPLPPMSDMTLKAVINRINQNRVENELPQWVDPKSARAVVPHGFRSSFRDWAAEITHYPNEMAEMAVAHIVNNKVEAAYRRGDMFEKRRQMMNDWAVWCESNAAAVVPLRANGTL